MVLIVQPSSERGEAGVERHESKLRTDNEIKRRVGVAIFVSDRREKEERV